MSEENGKVCCNCRHNIRYHQDGNRARVECRCDLDNHYIGYIECMEYWCRHWAKEKEFTVKDGDEDVRSDCMDAK